MIKVLFICHGSRLDSRELAALVGQNGAKCGFWDGGYYGFTTSEETKKKSKDNIGIITNYKLSLIVISSK